MPLFFNIAGPCVPGKHYMLPSLERLPQVDELIEREQYFVIHAARQTGKTTFLKALVDKINGEGEYYALYCSLEKTQKATAWEEGIRVVWESLDLALRRSGLPFTGVLPAFSDYHVSSLVGESLRAMCEGLDKPLVLLFDEADCLEEMPLISFLRQIREGFISRRRAPFPHSLALVGMRNIRDYKAQIRPDSESLGTASPFNIAAEALTLKNFTSEEVGQLYGQHTEATGQVFLPEAIERAWYWSGGHPWLVNALARQIVDKDLAKDYSQTITPSHLDAAAETLKIRRDTHIDSLLARLAEPRVRKIIEPMLTGDLPPLEILDDDLQFCIDMGLIIHEKQAGTRPANPIYADVMVRYLNYITQWKDMPAELEHKWIADGKIDMEKLLKEFQRFWRENSDIWVERYTLYKEAAPHLILQAFLQRVKNDRAEMERDYALGTYRVDLLLRYEGVAYPVEVKLAHMYYRNKEAAHVQLAKYMDKCGADEGWLVIFDKDVNKGWDEKIFWKDDVTVDGKPFHVVGC